MNLPGGGGGRGGWTVLSILVSESRTTTSGWWGSGVGGTAGSGVITLPVFIEVPVTAP